MKDTIPDAFDGLGIGIAVLDPETGDVHYANDRLETLHGYSIEQLREMNLAEYSADGPRFSESVMRQKLQAAAGGEPQTYEWQLERPDGDSVWVETQLSRQSFGGETYLLAEVRDITGRKKQAEATMQFEAAADAGAVGTWEWYVQKDQMLVGPAFARTFGIDPEQAQEGVPLGEFTAAIHADDRGYVEEQIETALEECGEYRAEYRVWDADGALRWVIARGHVECDGSGTPVRFPGALVDITDRKEYENQLRAHERALETLHETISRPGEFEEKVAELLDHGREYMGVEQGFLTNIGGDTQRIVVGVGPNEQLQDGAAAPFSESYCRHTVGPAQEEPLTVTHASEEGWGDDPAHDRFGLACYAGATVVVDGDQYGTICFADREPKSRAFTEAQQTYVELLTDWAGYEIERRLRERELQRNQALLRQTEDVADVGGWEYDARESELRMTQGTRRIFDIDEDDPALDDVLDFYVPEDRERAEAALTRCLETGEPLDEELQFTRTTGENRWLRVSGEPADEDGDVVAVHGAVQDITHHKAYEQQLEQSNERLQRFAYILSHDLQEPLRMVASYLEILAAELDDTLDEETREYIDFAVDGAERMQRMIDGLLEYSRVESRGGEFRAVDAQAVFETVEQDLELRIEEEEATVRAETLPTVYADEQQLGQLFQNLVGNALNHGGSGVTVEVTAEERATAYEFAVTDDGPGIPENRRKELFEFFETAADSDGTGMGLAICQRIVERHDGEIWVDGDPDEGTTVSFTLPKP